MNPKIVVNIEDIMEMTVEANRVLLVYSTTTSPSDAQVLLDDGYRGVVAGKTAEEVAHLAQSAVASFLPCQCRSLDNPELWHQAWVNQAQVTRSKTPHEPG